MTAHEWLILALEILAGLAGWLALSVAVWWLITRRNRRELRERESLDQHYEICDENRKRLGFPPIVRRK